MGTQKTSENSDAHENKWISSYQSWDEVSRVSYLRQNTYATWERETLKLTMNRASHWGRENQHNMKYRNEVMQLHGVVCSRNKKWLRLKAKNWRVTNWEKGLSNRASYNLCFTIYCVGEDPTSSWPCLSSRFRGGGPRLRQLSRAGVWGRSS